jgi:pimeloyl-ACP methyl ester carboxylesterase
MSDTEEVSEHLDVVGGVPVRSLGAGDASGSPHVVVLPGLGAVGYLVPFARAVAEAGATISLLDLPGFGTPGGLASRPTVEGIGAAAAEWVRECAPSGDVVLFGHSTGAQAAVHAGLRLQGDGRPPLVVLAGPTVAPSQRSLALLAAAAPAAYRRDSLRELVVVPDLVRARSDLLAMLRSAVADRPERNVASLRCRLLVTAGRRDTFAPASWLSVIATAAGRAPSVRVVRLPGSHNNPYTQPGMLAGVVVGEACRRASAAAGPAGGRVS